MPSIFGLEASTVSASKKILFEGGERRSSTRTINILTRLPRAIITELNFALGLVS